MRGQSRAAMLVGLVIVILALGFFMVTDESIAIEMRLSGAIGNGVGAICFLALAVIQYRKDAS